MKHRYILLFFFVVSLLNLHSQNLSTVFIDSLTIIYNNDTILNSYKTKVFFVPSNQESKIVLLKKGNIKVVLLNTVSHYSKHIIFYDIVGKNKYTFIGGSCVLLYQNDTLLNFPGHSTISYKENCDVLTEKDKRQSWSDFKPANICSLESSIRVINMAPIDTASYKLNYREGVWIGKNEKIDSVMITFKNDKKNGVAKIHYKDGTTYQTDFINNKRISPETFNFDAPKARMRRKRVIPQILTENCIEK